MPFDAVFLSAVVKELEPSLLGARIEKIQQPARDTVLLLLRGRENLLTQKFGRRFSERIRRLLLMTISLL